MFRETSRVVNRTKALKILTIDRVRLAVALDRSRDEADVVHLELRESNAEALGKAVDWVGLLSLDPGDEPRDRELAHVSWHVESNPYFVARRPKLARRHVNAAEREIEEHRRGLTGDTRNRAPANEGNSESGGRVGGRHQMRNRGDLRVASGAESCQSCYDPALPT